ncbi:phosphatase PAP2 family protein [Cellulomonas edaphi]|uniref:Phosphatase PAP2 family protein n=1 Tax=Cellulomonas edaphi TaxID=3053468 RepID=A0ABT7S427_9CELL|nr:phosphatase PAP2 family protein [Cellulomons edaphi]MDM7830381.1 phosphatase PAP2 family protein [Cellulomons edaphi]
MSPRRPVPLVAVSIVVAAVSVVGVWVLWRVFVGTWAGQSVDQAVIEGATYGQNQLWRVAEKVLDVVSVGLIAVVLLAAVVIAVVRHRWELAVQAAIVMIGANLTTRVLKEYVFERPELGVPGGYGNTLPSGHTTAAASISVVLMLVVSPRVRPWAAVLGAAYTTATGVSTLIGRWHRPSDVVAAVLVVLAWTAATCAFAVLVPRWGLPGDRGAVPRATRVALASLVAVGLVAGAVAGVTLSATWSRLPDVSGRDDLLTAYLGGAAGTASAACLAFAVMLALRHAAASGLPRG